MEVIAVVGFVLRLLLRLYIIVLFARLILDWVVLLVRGFRPRGGLAVIVEAVYILTDPPIKLFRKVLPPIRLGNISLDLGWILTMLSCSILIAILP